MCRIVTTLRADNLHLYAPTKETELHLAWDRPLNVSDPLTYRMVINGTEEITPINETMYTLTNRQPGTPYQIQIYTSTFKDFGVTEEKIENNNPLQGTLCTKPAVPGSLETKIYSNTSFTLQFFKSIGRVESYNVKVTANTSSVSQNQSIKSEEVVGDWRNATFSNLVPGELYDVIIKAISCGLESEGRIDYFIIQPAIPGSLAKNTFSTNNVTLQFSDADGRVERYNVTIIANSSGQSFTQLFISDGTTDARRNVTFYNLEPGEFYDVRIKAISWGVESEDKLDYFFIRAPCGSSCLSGGTRTECTIGLTCEYIQAKSGQCCVCPSGQFGYQPQSGMCRNVTTLRTNNLRLNGPSNETELSLAWDRPLNVSDLLTYRMVINGTEEITPINTTTYTLTNRQPGTPYQIQIYTSTFKDFGVTEEKIENNNPLQGTFCTKPAVPGSLATNTYSNTSVTLQFFKSDGRVESYSVTVTANTSRVSQNQSIKSDEILGDQRIATFYNLVPGEFYDVEIKANSCGQESERRMDYFIIWAPYGWSCLSRSTPDECSIGLSCDYIQAKSENVCLCPSGQFGYQPHTGLCRNVTTLRADNLHLSGSPNETELSLAWDRPLNVSDPLTYRMVINGTEEITPINATMYTLTNRQPGTPYQIQIYTSTFKDFGVTEEKIENNNPLQATFFTKSASPGSLSTSTFSTPITLQFSTSDSRVESNRVTILANSSDQSFTELSTTTANSEPPHSNQVASTGAIVGGVVGGLCFVVIVVIVIYLLVRRRRNGDYFSSRKSTEPSETYTNRQSEEMNLGEGVLY